MRDSKSIHTFLVLCSFVLWGAASDSKALIYDVDDSQSGIAGEVAAEVTLSFETSIITDPIIMMDDDTVLVNEVLTGTVTAQAGEGQAPGSLVIAFLAVELTAATNAHIELETGEAALVLGAEATVSRVALQLEPGAETVVTALTATGPEAYSWGPVLLPVVIEADYEVDLIMNDESLGPPESGTAEVTTEVSVSGTLAAASVGHELAASFDQEEEASVVIEDEGTLGGGLFTYTYTVQLDVTAGEVDVVATNPTPLDVPEPDLRLLQVISLLVLTTLMQSRRRPVHA